ncbi:uncharacterized protein LOC126786938 [Argentina anserina]|uniref:uncharacterized protein LOC126786938 n=1 Tax=Argentina anserina TaxID=57926 RepID=UPI0021766C5D|nr:uncharacterized protein LOC126786938 [Potentilla anserina]
MAAAPFGCVLRDHNRRDRCRESNARATMGVFQKNLKSLVRDHLCISVSPTCGSNDANPENQSHNNDDSWVRDKEASCRLNKDENSNITGEREDGSGSGSGSVRHARVLDRWAFARQMVSKPMERQRSAEAEVISNKVENNNRKEGRDDGSKMSPKHARVLDRWAFAKKMVTKPTERQMCEEAEVLSVPNSAPSSARTSTSAKEETIARTDSLADLTKKGVGASSLVQIWEKRLHKSDSLKSNSNGNTISDSSRSSSGVSSTDNDIENENNASPSRVSEAEKAESPVEKAGDSVFSIEKAGDSDFHMDKARESIDDSYDAGEVAEYSLEDSDGIEVDSRNLDAKEKEKNRVVDIIRRLTAQGPSTSEENSNNDHDQQYSLSHVLKSSHVLSSPRIRGRQAFADLLMQMERDRHKELDTLVNQKSVTRFPQRGRTRIQSLLRLRLLQRGTAFVGSDVPPLPPKPSRVNKPAQGSSIMQLREKFCTSLEQGAAVQCDVPFANSPRKEIINKSVNAGKLSTSNKPSESTTYGEVKVMEKPKTSTLLRAGEAVCKEATSSLDKSSTFNKPSASTPNREVKAMEKENASTVLSAGEDVCKEAAPNLDKCSTSNKPSASTPNEVNFMEKQTTVTVLRASEDVSKEAIPSVDKSSTSNKPSASTPNREVKVIEKQKTSTVLLASEDLCKEVTASLDKSSHSNNPSESTCNREVKVMEQQKPSPIFRASEDVCAERTLTVENCCTSTKPSESTLKREVSIMEQQKTSPVLRPSENVCKEATPSLEVANQETKSVSKSTLPHVSEGLTEVSSSSSKVTRKETSLIAQNLDAQETANPATLMNGSDETEIWTGKGSMDRNLDSKDTADKTSSNGHDGNELWKPTTSSEARYLDSQQSADTRTPLSGGDSNGNEISRGTIPEARNLETQETADTISSLNSWTEKALWHETKLEAANFDSQENADTTTSMVDWDENDDYYQYYGETNYDWISEISRPRSYWEDIRKSWYQEMLNSNSEKGEIHQLLERRTVSSFLSSDFRDKIDRLMVSRVERQTCHNASQEEEDDESSHDRMNEMVSFLQQRMSTLGTEEEAEEGQEHVHVQEQDQVQDQVLDYVEIQVPVQEENQVQEQVLECVEIQEQVLDSVQVQEKNQVQEQVIECVQVQEHVPEHQDQGDTEEEEEEDNDDNDDGDDESRSLISGQFQEAIDYFDHVSLQPSPSHFTTWSYQDNEVGDDSDQATSESPRQQSPFQYSPQRSPSQSYNANLPHCYPSISHPSMEMELIYDMKGHMIQLYQEMSELRKVIKSCVEMQMTMHQSMKQDVHSGQVGKKSNSSGLKKKGNCRICNEAKIDSLLYRCGHMCTCLKCAHDLQWNSGKCPICEAPIADVVRAYMDS